MASALASWVAGLALLVPPFQDAKDTSGADVDGPYVFEDGGGWIAKRVILEESRAVPSVEKFSSPTPELIVHLPGREMPLRVRVRPPDDRPPCRARAARVFAVSDMEGNVVPLIRLLRAAGVVDDALGWTFGDGHVVVLGDVFDRGLHVTECLWLLYEIEGRAKAAGGAVHMVLGNHEVMNLTGDLRYVRRKYLENAPLMSEKYADLYGRRTVLGRWLRTRPALLRIGDELFVHGGISPKTAESKPTLESLNEALRTALLADSWPKPEGPLRSVTDGKEGLLWYRGYLKDPIDEKTMDGILAAFEVKRIVVGHTIVENIDYALGGRVLALDVRHARDVNQAALLVDGEWHRLKPGETPEKLKPK